MDWFVGKELCYYWTIFDFKICPRARKVSGRFEKQGPGRCKLSEYWLFIGSNYAGVTPYTGVLHY